MTTLYQWPIGAHYCRNAYVQARDLNLTFTWLHADGLTGDARSVELHDAAGMLGSGMNFVLMFSLRSIVMADAHAWQAHVEHTKRVLEERGVLHRCLAVQLDDEYYTRMWVRGWDLRTLGAVVAQRADVVRQVFGPSVGFGVGMAETGAVKPPTAGIDWWGLNVYLGLHTEAQVATIYGLAVDLGRPIMPIIPVFTDNGQAPVPLNALAQCYLPLLERHAAHILAVGVFCLHHPSQYAPQDYPEGRGVIDLPPHYAAGVRYLTEVYGKG